MFRFSAGTEYTIRAIMRIAGSQEPLFIQEIADREAIPILAFLALMSDVLLWIFIG